MHYGTLSSRAKINYNEHVDTNNVMNKKNIAILAVVVIVLALFVLMRFSGAPETPGTPGAVVNEELSGAGAPSGEYTAPEAVSQPPSSGGTVAQAPGSISVVIPAPGETWLLGKSHSIRWSAEGKDGGGIELLDATTKAVIGWITPSLVAHQATVSWDTQSVLVAKTSPSKKDIVPGNYIMRINFDGPRVSALSSSFQIIRSGIENIMTHEVLVKSNLFVPNFLTVKPGHQVILVNDDSVKHTLQMNGTALYTVPVLGAYVFDTAGRAPGSYELRMKEQVTPKLTIVVQ